jgi:hypothetical protein
VDQAEPQVFAKSERYFRVTSVKHDIKAQEFEALKIPLTEGQEVRLLGDTTLKTPLAI